MRKVFKYIPILLTLIILFNAGDVYAKVQVLCQYKYSVIPEGYSAPDDYYITIDREKKNKDSYLIRYNSKDWNQVNGDLDAKTTKIDYSTKYHTFDDLFSDDNNYGAFEKKEIFNPCPVNAYRVNNKKNEYFTCFDNNGKFCNDKYGDKVKQVYKYDEGTTVTSNGDIGFSWNNVEQREEAATEAFVTETKIVVPDPGYGDGEGCSGLFGPVITEDINTVLKYIKYIGPILVILLSILDFINAVSSGSGDTFNTAWKKLLKRLIVALLLFFVVVLLKYIFNIFGITVPDSCLK